jgi:hypothetical protein
VVGDWLTNETSITVLPREDGDVKVAQVRSELMRSIELQSKAARVYSSSLAQMVACGISNFRVDVENAYEDAFERDIFIRDIPDPLAVRWDPLANDPTGRDATFCFVAEGVRTEEYERRFPKAALPSLIEKLENAGCDKAVVGLVVPTGYSFNLDGTNIYMTLAALFIAQALDVHLTLGQEALLLGVAMLSSKGAAGVTGAGFITLAATLSIVPDIPVAGMALILGVDRFMSQGRSLTNFIGNAVATIVVARWEGALDKAQLDTALKG